MVTHITRWNPRNVILVTSQSHVRAILMLLLWSCLQSLWFAVIIDELISISKIIVISQCKINSSRLGVISLRDCYNMKRHRSGCPTPGLTVKWSGRDHISFTCTQILHNLSSKNQDILLLQKEKELASYHDMSYWMLTRFSFCKETKYELHLALTVSGF